ncbi:hypothetical protein [Nibricoccus sp. IMCC34717]|uniref:hypothetical protein n=1 Tax=Nibricoccus sp. IMCC34717 TaxID=3034021 RepID=UPI00384E5E81
MKTIASFSKPIDAHLLIARLEGSGVRAFARDENMVTVDWIVSNAIGGVKVDVSDEDFLKALEIANSGSEQIADSKLRSSFSISDVLISIGIGLLASIGFGSVGRDSPEPDWVFDIIIPSVVVSCIAYSLLRLRTKRK